MNLKGGNMKIYSILIILILIPTVIAIDNLGTVKQNNCIRLPQTCSSCSYVNISSVSNSASNESIISNVAMTSLGNGEWGYTFCGTSAIGRYDVRGMGDIDGVDETFVYHFEVTPSGFEGTLGFYIILMVIVVSVIVLGFAIGEEWFVIIGGFALIMVGIYSINYGIAGFRDMFMTWGIGLFEIAIGAILSIGSAIQKIDL